MKIVARPSARQVLLDDSEGDDFDSETYEKLEKKFFNQLVLPNQTLKTTDARRLTDVDRVCNTILKAEARHPVRILDIAVSSGITTIEWSESLNKNGITHTIDAFDKCVEATIVSFFNSFHVLTDSTGRPLQFEFNGFVLENYLGESFSRQIRRALPIVVLRVMFRICRSISIVSSRALPVKLVARRLRSSETVDVFEFDMMNVDQLPKKYTFVRAANILNLAYFERPVIKRAVQKILSRIESDGYLCIVRTHDDKQNHGTVFQLKDGALKVVDRIGNGSEVEDCVVL